MARSTRQKREDRIFVQQGRRHHRRTYSALEFRIGLGVLAVLGVLIAWVAWKGAHPDPELMGSDADLLKDFEPPADRGVLPEGLATAGWTEGAISHFGFDNLYEKINGREDYYKSFGFQRLSFVSLIREDDPETAVDIELYDLATPANALGALAGERPEGAPADVGTGGMACLDRNALLMTRGKHYLRAIGSAESPLVASMLEHLRRLFERDLTGEPIPTEYLLFVEGVGLDAERVSFTSENAFSFGFANNLYSAVLEDDETEVFVTTAQDSSAAADLAARFNEGFLEYGSAESGSNGLSWIQDRYIGSISGATSYENQVIGVRGAPDVSTAADALRRLRNSLESLPRADEVP